MDFLRDFIAGRTHKLARDFLFTGFVIIAACFGAVTLLTRSLEEMRVASRQQLPPRVATGTTQTQTIVRSVLDDNPTTASIGNRSIVLDPCTGKEKK